MDVDLELRYDSLLAEPAAQQQLRYRAFQSQIIALERAGLPANAELVRWTLVRRGISPISG